MKALNLVLIFVFAVSFSQEAKKLALVIGNADYKANPLENPVNDARLIGKTLDSLGFDVDLKENLSDNDSFLKAINDFGKKIPEEAFETLCVSKANIIIPGTMKEP